MSTVNLKAHGIEEVWAASVWWRNCDNLFTVVGIRKRDVEERAGELMDAEISEALADADGEQEAQDLQDELVWSGVHLYSVGTIVDANDDEHARELVEDGITVI